MPKALSFPLSHLYTFLVTVFGFAIFYFDKNLFSNLGMLFGIGCRALTDIFTNSVLLDNVILFGAALLFATPVVPTLWKKTGEKLPYSVQRILKTAVVVVFIAASTVRLVGNSYSPFLYFRF